MECSDCGLLGCDNIYCCTWTPTFFWVKVSLVKNMVKLSHATKGRWSISSTKREIGNTTQSKSIQVNGKCEEPRNSMVLFTVKISKQNDMEEDGAAHCSKMMASMCKSAWHHNRRCQPRSDSNELWLDGCKKGSEIYLYITAKGQSYCHSVVINITTVLHVGR
jgi:hypothetical protein